MSELDRLAELAIERRRYALLQAAMRLYSGPGAFTFEECIDRAEGMLEAIEKCEKEQL